MKHPKLRFLIAYGPTREPLDPVRYLSNYSTGIMGRALVDAATARGHQVTAIEAPTDAATAENLKNALSKKLPASDVLVMAAAVCDVRPAKLSATKIKKNGLATIKLVKNPDILEYLSKKKKKSQVFIGFALESEDIFKNAFEKLKIKKLEAIVLQRVSEKISPFGDQRLEAYLLGHDGKKTALLGISKKDLAAIVVLESEKFHSEKAKFSPKN